MNHVYLPFALLTTLYACTDGPYQTITFNRSLRSPCGTEPCRWAAHEGEVSDTATWHEGEPGFSLDGPGSSVSQTLTHLDGCLIFNLLVNSDPTAKVELQVDFEDDGSVDTKRVIPPGHFDLHTVELPIPEQTETLRATLVKIGTGRAVIGPLIIESTHTPWPLCPQEFNDTGLFCNPLEPCPAGLTCLGHRCASCEEDGGCPIAP